MKLVDVIVFFFIKAITCTLAVDVQFEIVYFVQELNVIRYTSA